MTEKFPLDVSAYRTLTLDSKKPLDEKTLAQWQTNIGLVRDTIMFFTASAGLRGVDGHTGGAYDLVPEALLADGFIRGQNNVYPVLFDEAGHRVALQYAMAAFNGDIAFDLLLKYRAHGHGLYGHVERNEKMGVGFSSGRLGHLWSMVDGVALAHPDKSVLMFGSDGSQMEGDDAEAARFAVAHRLNVKLLIDDNNITCAGNPSEFMPGFDVAKTLEGHGLPTDTGDGEDLKSLYARFAKALNQEGPVALVNKRVMAPGMGDLEGTSDAHGEIGHELASKILREHGHEAAARYLDEYDTELPKHTYRGSSKEKGSNRQTFGKTLADLVGKIPAGERRDKVLAIDSDLASSCGLGQLQERFPECFVQGGIMERNNFSAAAGFGFHSGRQGIVATFSAFLEMCISELTMARLNEVNMLCHFTHCGVDMIPDNTCHYGMNVFFADNGLLGQHPTPLYFPADPLQVEAVLKRIFHDHGIRFMFCTRPGVPYILDEAGNKFFEAARYTFQPGKDDLVRDGSDGFIVAFGDTLYRAIDAAETLKEQGLKVGVFNKATLNAIDEEALKKIGASRFVLVAETQNQITGLGIRFGTWLLERGYTPRYKHLGIAKPGEGGGLEQVGFHGLEPEHLVAAVRELVR
jgi:transketolase C-terminal domain/subunit/transketolase N-terminal domain/subunit